MGQQKKGRGASSRGNKRKPPKEKEFASELVPHRIIGQLMGKRVNEKGEQIAEEPIGPLDVFAPNFERIPEMIEADLQKAREAAKAEREGLEQMDGR